MSTSSRYLPHYTIDDYRSWDGDWELWQGIAVAITPSPFGRHQWVAGQLLTQLNLAIAASGCNDCFALAETDWIIAKDTIVRPDITVVCGSFPEQFIEQVPALVVEVLSKGTWLKDQNQKRNLYAEQGVKHYWLIDPANQNTTYTCIWTQSPTNTTRIQSGP